MKTTIVAGKNGSLTVDVEGLDVLMRFLKDSDPLMRKAVQDGLKEAAQPVLTRARANAMKIADDGTYAGSLSIRARANGSLVLRSSGDEAAGVKEYARKGARYRPKSTDKRRNARKMRSFPVGVPHRANPPCVMIPAVEDSAEEVKNRIDAKLEETLRRASDG